MPEIVMNITKMFLVQQENLLKKWQLGNLTMVEGYELAKWNVKSILQMQKPRGK